MSEAVLWITALLWGEGAFLGHFLAIGGLMVFKRFFGGVGGVISLVGATGMMLWTFDKMPVDNPAFIMVIGYMVVILISVVGFGGGGRRRS